MKSFKDTLDKNETFENLKTLNFCAGLGQRGEGRIS